MTLKSLIQKAEEILRESGVDSPETDSKLLLEAALGIPEREQRSRKDETVREEDALKALSFVNRRAEGEPLQYITGYWEFFGEKFFVGNGVLIPRDDTEVVLRASLDYLKKLKKDDLRILDICSGSGILAITLKKLYEKASIAAIEISQDALFYLRKNAKFHKTDIEIIEGDLFEKHTCFQDGSFDLIISNPPYITEEDMNTLQKEVLREPAIALCGGKDGCDFIRGIVSLYSRKLKKGGMLSLELDSEEAVYTTELMNENGYTDTRIFDDLGEIHRAVSGIYTK